jgi:hypothetical protein
MSQGCALVRGLVVASKTTWCPGLSPRPPRGRVESPTDHVRLDQLIRPCTLISIAQVPTTSAVTRPMTSR